MKRKFAILYRIAHGPIRHWTTETDSLRHAIGVFMLGVFAAENCEIVAAFDLSPFIQSMRMIPLESLGRMFPGCDSLAIKEAIINAGEKCA